MTENSTLITPTQEVNYRWYLCYQTTPMRWDCKETFGELAIDAYVYGREKRPSRAIPIPWYYPKFLDKKVLSATLNPKITIDSDHT
jgi:hypothetical protein